MDVYETLLLSPILDNYVFHDLLGRTLYWDYIKTGETQISIYTGKHNISTQKHTKGSLSPSPPPPPTPIPAHVGGKSPYIIFDLVTAWHKLPFSGIVALPYSDSGWSTEVYSRMDDATVFYHCSTVFTLHNPLDMRLL